MTGGETTKSKTHVFVCDDERHIVRLIQVNLERQGWRVTTAYSGEEALEKMRADRPDLLILGLNRSAEFTPLAKRASALSGRTEVQPDKRTKVRAPQAEQKMSGREVVQTMREDPTLADIKVILLNGKDEDDDWPDDTPPPSLTLKKPPDPRHLIEALSFLALNE